MTVHTALAVSALAAAVVLLLSRANRALVAVPLAASAVEVAMAFGVLRLHVDVELPLQLILGALIAVPALLLWLKATARTAISAASVLAFVGLLQATLALIR